MSCANPIPNTLYKNYYTQFYDLPWHYVDYFPCGRCLNCRVDRINQYTHRCEKEFIDKQCGAFVTFTYDDIHLLPHIRKNAKGEIVATLSRYECKKFLDRLNKLVHKSPSLPFQRHDYKYIITGEYGDQFKRPHYHALFFGLDYRTCNKLFARAWQGKGSIKVLPITNGAPRYLLDYITSLEYGEQRKIKYENNNIEPPFSTHSMGLGSSLYYEQLDYIKKHRNCYRWHGKDVPVPPYWRNKFLLPRNNPIYKWQKIQQKNLDSNIGNVFNIYNPETILRLYKKEFQKTKDREVNLRKKAQNNGRAILDLEKLTYDLHNYKIKTNLFYKECYKPLNELGYSKEQQIEMYKNKSNIEIDNLVVQALSYSNELTFPLPEVC